MGVSTLDCTSCGSCVASCPKSGKALKMVPAHEVSLDQTDWNFLTTVKEKTSRVDKFTLKGSQFKQPPGGVQRRLRRLRRDALYQAADPDVRRQDVPGQRHRLHPGLGRGYALRAVLQERRGQGRCVESNSLFENNAEFSYGMCLAVKQLRDCVTGYVKELDALTKDETVKAAIAKWLETYDDLDASTPATEELVKLLESGKFSAEEQKLVDEILKRKKGSVQEDHVDVRRRRLGVRHRLRRSGSRVRHGRGRQRPAGGHRGLLQHRRPVLQGHACGRGGPVPGQRQEDQEEGPLVC